MHDLVTLGEVLLRLAIPSPARVETVRQLDVQIGGAAKVSSMLARFRPHVIRLNPNLGIVATVGGKEPGSRQAEPG